MTVSIAFKETGLAIFFRDDVGNSEIQGFFGRLLGLQLLIQVHSSLFLVSQIQKEYFIQDVLDFVTVFLIKVLLKPDFLKQTTTDLEQYPLAPTFIAKRFTNQSLYSLIDFRAGYNLSIVP